MDSKDIFWLLIFWAHCWGLHQISFWLFIDHSQNLHWATGWAPVCRSFMILPTLCPISLPRSILGGIIAGCLYPIFSASWLSFPVNAEGWKVPFLPYAWFACGNSFSSCGSSRDNWIQWGRPATCMCCTNLFWRCCSNCSRISGLVTSSKARETGLWVLEAPSSWERLGLSWLKTVWDFFNWKG